MLCSSSDSTAIALEIRRPRLRKSHCYSLNQRKINYADELDKIGTRGFENRLVLSKLPTEDLGMAYGDMKDARQTMTATTANTWICTCDQDKLAKCSKVAKLGLIKNLVLGGPLG